jgi:Na+/H+-dicarboxylate symporter
MRNRSLRYRSSRSESLHQGHQVDGRANRLRDGRRGHRHHGRYSSCPSVGLKTIIYFEIVSTLALNVDPKTFDTSLVASYVNQAKSLTITDFLLNIIPTTFVDPFVKGEVLQILFVAVLFELALCQIGGRAKRLSASSIRS